MTEPTQAAKQRACDLANALWSGSPDARFGPQDVGPSATALLALAQLCQDNDKAATEALGYLTHHDDCTSEAGNYQVCSCGLYQARAALSSFRLPDEPDVLAEALEAAGNVIGTGNHTEWSTALRAALAQRGHEVTPIEGNV